MIDQGDEFFTAEMESQVSERVTSDARRHGIAVPVLGRQFWEQRWESARTGAQGVESQPNRTLVDTAAQLPAGVALDAGCGEGVDAVWLAARGWAVTAVDFVASALDSGRRRAEELDADVARRIDWQKQDLSTWTPPAGGFDLVTTHYLHGVAERDKLFRRLAAAVRPGGTLLIVGHHPAIADSFGARVPRAVYFSTADVLAVLDDGWQRVTVSDDVPRPTVDHEGRPITLRSAVVRVRREMDPQR